MPRHPAAVFVLSAILMVNSQASEPGLWRFGIIGDTQYYTFGMPDDYSNSVPVKIIRQIDAKFIEAGVKFVIQVGDLTENRSLEGMATRDAVAQELYERGIGFFPMRGNHESQQQHAVAFQAFFPQTQGLGPRVFGATNFCSPFQNLAGLSYSFDYANTRFVILDQYYRTDGSIGPDPSAWTGVLDQLPWLHERLTSDPKPGKHLFVLGHENLVGQSHGDTLFGSPAQYPDLQNAFTSDLQTNGVRYYISGHDHMHHRSMVASPDGLHRAQQIICCSASTKYYVPLGSPLLPDTISNDAYFDNPLRETPITQECYKVGYYIYTVDGPRVTVDYFSADIPSISLGSLFMATEIPPQLNFVKKETFGYSLNGGEFLVPRQASYNRVQYASPVGDGYHGTRFQVLAGFNQSTNADAAGRPFAKLVNVGWHPAARETCSDILSLWGLLDLGCSHGDPVALSLSYSTGQAPADGTLCLAVRDDSGRWHNAVDNNAGGGKRFVAGPWNPSCGLGTYGIDTESHTVWAVVDREGVFAVASLPYLRMDREGDQIILTWPTGLSCELQTCTDLSKADWSPVSPVPGGNRFVITSQPGTSRYYRLALH